MKKFWLLKYLLVLILFFIINGSACKKKDNPTEPETPDEQVTDWKTSDSKTYTVPSSPNSKVDDNISGNTFIFPTGGGQLVVSKITSGPSTASSDNAFSIDYTGTGQIQILLNGKSGENYIAGYIPLDGNGILIDDGKAQGVWMPLVEKDNGNGTLTFTLPYLKQLGKTAWKGSSYYKSINMSKLPDKSKFETMIREAANVLINAIPTSRKQKVMDDINGSLTPQVYVNTDVTTPCYKPFWDMMGIANRKIFMFNPKDSKYNVAHEVGHYFHHVLLGSGYSSFANNPRGNIWNWWTHSIGTKGAKYNIIEEPAYLAEYFIYGSIKQRNPEAGDFLVNNFDATPTYINSPEKDDWLDLEGAGVALIGSLFRSSGSITNYKGKSVTVPVINTWADKTPMFQDVYEIIANNCNSIPSLRDKLLSLVTSKWGGMGSVPVIWQAMGYSYHAKMRFVDKDNKPVAGVTAQCFVNVDGHEYQLPKNDKASGADGVYTLEEVYPSISSLRVYYTKNGAQVQADLVNVMKVDWDSPTNVEVDLGDIQLENESILPLLQKTIVCAVQYEAMCNLQSGETMPLKQMIDNNTSGVAIKWSGQGFSMSKTWSTNEGGYNKYDRTLSIAGSVSADGRILVTATAVYDEKWYETSPSSGAENLLRTTHKKIICSNIKNTSVSTNQKSFGYVVFGNAAQLGLGAFEYSEVWTTGSSIIYSSTKWDDSSVEPTLVVAFIAQ